MQYNTSSYKDLFDRDIYTKYSFISGLILHIVLKTEKKHMQCTTIVYWPKYVTDVILKKVENQMKMFPGLDKCAPIAALRQAKIYPAGKLRLRQSTRSLMFSWIAARGLRQPQKALRCCNISPFIRSLFLVHCGFN